MICWNEPKTPFSEHHTDVDTFWVLNELWFLQSQANNENPLLKGAFTMLVHHGYAIDTEVISRNHYLSNGHCSNLTNLHCDDFARLMHHHNQQDPDSDSTECRFFTAAWEWGHISKSVQFMDVSTVEKQRNQRPAISVEEQIATSWLGHSCFVYVRMLVWMK